MPLTFSNLLPNPLQSALLSKTSTSPYKSLISQPTSYQSLSPQPTVYKSLTGTAPAPAPTTTAAPKPTGAITGSNLNNAVSNLNQYTAQKVPTSQPLASTPQQVSQPAQNYPAYTPSLPDAGPGSLINMAQQQRPTQFQTTLRDLTNQEPNEYQTGALANLLNYNKSPQDIEMARANLAKQIGLDINTLQGINNKIMPIEFIQGREQVARQAQFQKESALEGILGNLLTGRQQDIGAQSAALTGANTLQSLKQQALSSAAGLMQPTQVPYSNQFVDPITGQPIGGGSNTSGSLQNAVANIAQKVQSGTMSYNDGVSALNAYGQAGVNALQQALGPNFDVVGSNAKAQAAATNIQQTGSVGGALQKSADSARQALIKLETDFAKLSQLQTGGIPATNSIANWIASNFGQGALSAYQTTLADARAQLQGVLTASGGATPTGAESMAMTYLPDNMTPTQFQEKLSAARALVDQKVSAFTTSQPLGGSAGSSSGSQYDW